MYDKKIVIRSIQRVEIPEAAALVGRATHKLPVTSAVLKGNGDRERLRVEAMWKVVFEHLPGNVIVAKKDGKILGVMRFARSPDCQVSVFNGLKISPLMLKALGGSSLRMLKWIFTLSKHDPKQSHWHIDPIAVLPEMQRQGVGSLLMQHFCRHVDRLGEPGYLETDRKENLDFYRKFGFSVSGQTEIFGLSTWFMWREPFG